MKRLRRNYRLPKSLHKLWHDYLVHFEEPPDEFVENMEYHLAEAGYEIDPEDLAYEVHLAYAHHRGQTFDGIPPGPSRMIDEHFDERKSR